VIIINDTLARRFFPNEDPIGERLFVGFSPQTPRRIVGVVGDERHNTLRDAPTPGVYTPYFQVPWSRSMSLAVRSRTQPAAVLAAVREQIRAVAQAAPIYEVKTMEQVMAESVAQPRFSSLMLGLFAGGALLLASCGVYGVLSYAVSQSTREIGLRLSLGAQRADIFKLVVGRGMVLVAAGMGLGLAASAALMRYLQSLLFEVKPTDPVTLAGVCVLLALVALAACYLPARRATQVDPMVALRHE
jgi:putative ABC transport system permease protein